MKKRQASPTAKPIFFEYETNLFRPQIYDKMSDNQSFIFGSELILARPQKTYINCSWVISKKNYVLTGLRPLGGNLYSGDIPPSDIFGIKKKSLVLVWFYQTDAGRNRMAVWFYTDRNPKNIKELAFANLQTLKTHAHD